MPAWLTKWWFGLLMGLMLAVAGFALIQSLNRLGSLKSQLAAIKAANLELDRANKSLYQKVQRLREDPKALARACRYDMGLVRSDEVVYRLAEGSAARLPGGTGR